MIFLYILIGVYSLGMLFIFLYSLAQGHLLLRFLGSKNYLDKVIRKQPEEWPKVTIQLPIFNELYVVDRLIEAVSEINYPAELLEIQVLDDSTDQTSELIKEKLKQFPEVNFTYLHRIHRKGFKAGALEAGLAKASGEFIAIFDADFVPDPDFLLKVIPFFASPKVGLVQSRWTHLNKNYSLITRLQAFALDAHFLIEQIGRNSQHAFINFNGTGGVWRKSCIIDAGNWQDDTLTEDLDLSYRAQRKGWEFVYRPEIESPAELPPIMSAVKSQQFRWTKGGAECASKHAKSVLKEHHSLGTKIHAMAHLFNSTLFIAIFLVSLSSIGVWYAGVLGLIPTTLLKVAGLFMIGFLIIAGVYLVAYFYEKRSFWKSFLQATYMLPLFLSVSMGLALHNSQAVWEGLTGKKSPFIRTPKFNLESGKSSLATNSYLKYPIPITTWFEGVLMLVFIVMVGLHLYMHTYSLLPFHLMLAIGYGLVFFTSFKAYRLSK